MPQNKKQHYVPQFLLRNFHIHNSTKQIALYNITQQRQISSANISKQACGDYFYSEDTDFDKALSIVECEASVIISKIIDKETMIESYEETYKLLYFITLQKCRTKWFMDEVTAYYKEHMTKWKDMVSEHYPEKNLDNYEIVVKANKVKLLFKYSLSTPLISDLKRLLLINQTDIPFVISDNPVVIYNPLLFNKLKGNNEGICLIGMCLLFPISPRLCIFLYDNEYYGVRNFETNVALNNIDDVVNINTFQCLNADLNIYTNQGNCLREIGEMYEANNEYKVHSNHKNLIKVQDGECIDGSIIKDAHVITNMKHTKNIKLSFLKQKKLLSDKRYSGGDLIRDPILLEEVKDKIEWIMNEIENGNYENVNRKYGDVFITK